MKLLAIELDQHLAGLDAIAEVGEHAADDALGLRGDRDLVLGGERADDFEGAANRLLADRLGLDRLDRLLCPAGFGARVCTAGGKPGNGAKYEQCEGTPWHKTRF